MEIDNNKNIFSQETNGSGEEFEEYEEVESIMHQDESSASEEELKRCRFCW